MATGEIFQLQGKDSVLRLNHYAAVNAVQSFDWSPTFNEELYDELGNAEHTAQSISPEVSGSFEMTATGSTVAFLKRMINKYNAGTGEFEGYLAGDPASADNAGTITGSELERAIFDLIEAKKANEAFTRSLLLPRMHLSQLAWRADSNGAATETYSFEGELAEVYRDPMHDLVSVPVVRKDAATVTVPAGFTLDPATGYAMVQLMVDDEIIDAASLTENATTPNDVDVAGFAIPIGARLALVLYKAVPGAFPAIDYPTTSRFVRADDIDIFLVPKATVDIAGLADAALNAHVFSASDRLLRVQSADINVDLRREALRQIAQNSRNTSVYYRAATYPLAVTASASSFETDLADWQKIQGKNGTDVLNLGDFENMEWQLVLRYYKGSSVLQTIAFMDARVSGRSARVSVGGRAEVTWNFTGSAIKIEGSDI